MRPRSVWTILLCLIWLCFNMSPLAALRDPCHRWHSCSSDRGTYTCGDTSRCAQCPDNAYCLNREPRIPAPSPSVDTPPMLTRQALFIDAVVGLANGDTRSVLREGKAVTVRLHGFDTPEKAQAFGTRARRFASDLAFRQTVTVRVRDTDRYDRLVAEVIQPNGRSLNHELVKAGMAWWYRQYAPGDTALAQLEVEAKVAKRGLWSDPHAVAPWVWQQQRRR